jgi:hypothetical protein
MTSTNRLAAEAATALEAYRLVLTPAAYCFASEMQDGKPTERILEVRMPLAGAAQEREYGVVFGFWPDGFSLDKSKAHGAGDPSCTPPPIAGVAHLHKAPASFLTILTRHVQDKMVQLAQEVLDKERASSARNRPSGRPDSQQLVAEAAMALEVYRRMLPAGHYRFYAEMMDGEPTGRIIEEQKEIRFPCAVPKTERGVLFGFWPWGFPAELLAGVPALAGPGDFPQIVEVARLSRAPDHFLELLAQHVNDKTGLHPGREREPSRFRVPQSCVDRPPPYG